MQRVILKLLIERSPEEPWLAALEACFFLLVVSNSYQIALEERRKE
jgi:hypothetical protein